MKVCVFSDKEQISKDCFRQENINATLAVIAETTDTTDLVVAVYLLGDSHTWRGCLISKWLTPTDYLICSKRSWILTRSFETPQDLPARFKLIRLAFGLSRRYSKSTLFMYGWKLSFRDFNDHLAYLFAHELHHFRRYHLGLHPREGEQSACRWAVERTKETGFRVEGVRIQNKKRRKTGKPSIRVPIKRNPKLLRRLKMSASHLCSEDLKDLTYWADRRVSATEKLLQQKHIEERYDRLRSLANGAVVRITGGDGKWRRYVGQTAVKIQTLKRNSSRLAIRTQDDRELNWPMQCLEVVE
jgi:hypothetical protein